jgi:hypothetical protein
MDWKTIITSIFSSSLIAAAICYLIKISFDRSVEVLVDKLKEENRAAIAETSKKKSFVLERQYEPYQLMVSRAYSLRCAVRELCKPGRHLSDEQFKALVNNFRVEYDNLNDGMIAGRVIFTPVFWSLVHDFRNVANAIIIYTKFIQKRIEENRRDEDVDVEETLVRMRNAYHDIENGYMQIVMEAQMTLGVTGISISNKS